jgi:cobyrinic acid a,c-diamide synthase
MPEPRGELFNKTKPTPTVTIAVAKDAAFHFYYPENLALLEQAGAKLHYFSPLQGELVPEEADGLFLGGSFSDQMLPLLAAQEASIQSIALHISRGMPTFAECGGYMYLCKQCLDRHGNAYPMAGVIPAVIQIQEKRAALGYREVKALTDNPLFHRGERARGHEFHYSVIVERSDDFPSAYESHSRWGSKVEGFTKDQLLAGFTHLYFASSPVVVKRWIAACQNYRQQKGE